MAEAEPREYPPDIIEKLLDRLAAGESLLSISRDATMPSARTIQRWSNASGDLSARIMEAREAGYYLLADKAIEDLEKATDPAHARNVFEGRKWHLGKLSRAFAEKPVQIDARVLVGNDDAFAAVAEALNRASETIAGSGSSTRLVAPEGATGPTDPAGD